MIVSVCLSKGAIAMSREKVIVKRLNAIQNFGGMDVLCTDKTGTLTYGKPEITDIVKISEGLSENEILALIGSAEQSSEHPLAEAVVAVAGESAATRRLVALVVPQAGGSCDPPNVPPKPPLRKRGLRGG